MGFTERLRSIVHGLSSQEIRIQSNGDEALIHTHELHESGVDRLVTSLERNSFEVDCKTADGYGPDGPTVRLFVTESENSTGQMDGNYEAYQDELRERFYDSVTPD